MNIYIKILSGTGKIPTKNNKYDAGWDIYSAESVLIKTGTRSVVHTGIAVKIPDGYFASIRDRSGMAAKAGIHVLAGVIDCGYRGEWMVVLMNLGSDDYEIKVGDRIAQAVIHEVPEAETIEVAELDDSDRGVKGFGNSGK